MSRFGDQPKGILIVKPSALGDVIQHVVVARALKERFPNATLGWLVKHQIAPIIEPLPFLDHIHHFHRVKGGGLAGLGESRKRLKSLPLEMQAVGYDTAIDLQGLMRSSYLAKASGAKRRIGFREAKELAWLFYNDAHRTQGGQHVLERSFDLIEAAGITLDREVATDLCVSEAEVAAVKELIPDRERLIVLSPGSLWASKMWPAEKFIELGQRLAERGRVIVSGAPNEAELCARVSAGIEGSIDLSGKTSLRELAALFSISGLAIANDSAPTHLARAQNCPQVALFGTSDPIHAGPWRRPEDVIFSPAGQKGRKVYRKIPDDRIMREITVESVLEAASSKLEASKD